MKTKEKEEVTEIKSESGRFCPLGDYDCSEFCVWWVEDSGLSECAIVKLAKGWCV